MTSWQAPQQPTQNTTATADQIDEAVRINAAARLRALSLYLLILARVGLLVIVPARRLPNYRPVKIPAGPGGDRPPSVNRPGRPATTDDSKKIALPV